MEKLEFAQSLTDNIIKSSIDGILAYDLDYRYTVWNPAMERITGLTRDYCIGKKTFEVFPFLIEIGEHQYFSESLQGKSVLSVDRHYIVPETNRRGYFEAIYSPLYDDRGKIIGGFSLVRETSEWKRAYRAARESELKLNHVNRVVSDAVITCTRQGKILSWNESAETLFRLPAAQAIGSSISDFLPEYDWALEFTRTRVAAPLFGFFGRRRDGSDMPVAISASRFNLSNDAFLSLAIKDLSAITHLENQAAEQREFAEALMQAQNELRQGVAVVDTLTDRPIFLNQAFADMTGYERNKLLELRQMAELVSPAELPLMKKRIEMRLKTDKTRDFYELTLIHKNGTPINVEIAVTQLETSFGVTSFNLIRDITKRKHFESSLRRSQKEMELMTEITQDAVATLDTNSNILDVNLAFTNLFDETRNAQFDKPFPSLISDEDKGAFQEIVDHFGDRSFAKRISLKYVLGAKKGVPLDSIFVVVGERGREPRITVYIRHEMKPTK